MNAQSGHLSIVKYRLAAGADPAVRRVPDGLTARDLAVGNGHAWVAAILTAVGSEGL